MDYNTGKLYTLSFSKREDKLEKRSQEYVIHSWDKDSISLNCMPLVRRSRKFTEVLKNQNYLQKHLKTNSNNTFIRLIRLEQVAIQMKM
jgi:hypothetical protein